MTVTDEQVINDRLDLEMLERPHLWPSSHNGVRCVFVKKGGAISADYTGPCLLSAETPLRETKRYIILAHDWSNGGKITIREYDSAEDIIADGWMVD